METKTCLFCSNPLLGKWQQKYCSRECASKHFGQKKSAGETKKIECPTCHKVFRGKFHQHVASCPSSNKCIDCGIKVTRAKTRCKNCYLEKMKERSLEAARRRKFICKACGVEFSYAFIRKDRKMSGYCSARCLRSCVPLPRSEKRSQNAIKQGGYHPGSGIGRKGKYNGIWCDSSWELAFLIFCTDMGIPIKRNRNRYEYYFNGNKFRYIPDFIVFDSLVVEIKGRRTEKDDNKITQCPISICVIGEDHIKPYILWAKQRYGVKFHAAYDNGRKASTGESL